MPSTHRSPRPPGASARPASALAAGAAALLVQEPAPRWQAADAPLAANAAAARSRYGSRSYTKTPLSRARTSGVKAGITAGSFARKTVSRCESLEREERTFWNAVRFPSLSFTISEG